MNPGGVQEAATMQRMSVDDAVDPYLQSRVAAAQQRTCCSAAITRLTSIWVCA